MGRQADPLHVEQGVGRLGYGFGGKHVQPRPPDNAPVQRVDQLLLADHVAPGGVDQDGAVLHHLKLPPPDGTPGLRRGGNVEGDDVRVPEEAVHALRPLNTVRQPGGIGVVAQHPHAEALGRDLRHVAADAAAAHEAQGLACQLKPPRRDIGGKHPVIPPVLPEAGADLLGVSGAFQHQHDCRLRHRAAVDRRRIGDVDALFGGVVHVHRLVAHAPPGDQPQLRGRVYNSPVETSLRLLKGDQGAAAGDVPADARLGGLQAPLDRDAAPGQLLRREGGHVVVDQYRKSHRFTPPLCPVSWWPPASCVPGTGRRSGRPHGGWGRPPAAAGPP